MTRISHICGVISHIQLFLAALAFAVLAPLPLAHAQNAVPWFHGVLPMGTDVPPHLLQGGVSGDFDGDGTEDIMCLESKQMNIAWNSFEGLAPFRPLPFPNGELRGGAWDAASRTLWLVASHPERIETWTFQGTSPRPSKSFSLDARSWHLTPGAGMTVVTSLPTAIHFLEADGSQEILVPDASEIQAAIYVPAQRGSGLLVLQEAGTGAVGCSVRAQGLWSEATWWASTERTHSWQLALDDDGISVTGATRMHLWHRALDVKGQSRYHWTNPALESANFGFSRTATRRNSSWSFA